MKVENKRKKNMDEWKMAWQSYKQKQMEEEAYSNRVRTVDSELL